jgi:hypothetical protein
MDLIILNSFLLLTLCGARMTHRQFRTALKRNLIEKARRLRYPRQPMGRPMALEKQATRLAINFSNHWPVQSSRLYFQVCSKWQIKRTVQVMMWDIILVSILKPTIPNPRYVAVYKGVGNLRTSPPKKCAEENIYFACFLLGNLE